MSVTNDGVISILGVLSSYSWTYVSSIADPTKDMTLTEYTMQRTTDAINLADYMTYETPDGPQVAEGTATLAGYDAGFVAWQYNGFGDNMRYETVVVRYEVESADEVLYDNSFVAYPNPTDGIINLSEGLSNVQLFDIAGRCVYSTPNVVNSIDLTDFDKGVYMLVANDGEKNISLKVVKK